MGDSYNLRPGLPIPLCVEPGRLWEEILAGKNTIPADLSEGRGVYVTGYMKDGYARLPNLASGKLFGRREISLGYQLVLSYYFLTVQQETAGLSTINDKPSAPIYSDLHLEVGGVIGNAYLRPRQATETWVFAYLGVGPWQKQKKRNKDHIYRV